MAMKCYTFYQGETAERIILNKDGRIQVGEEGRGRRLLNVPLPAGANRSSDGGSLLSVNGNDSYCIVLIRDMSGYRGSWRLREARTPEEWRTVLLLNRAHRPPDGEGALEEGHTLSGACPACIALHGQRPAERSVDPDRCFVLAEGRCAQGAAGGMGGGPEYLVRIRSGYAIEAVRTGRLYGSPLVYTLACVDGKLEVKDPSKTYAEQLAATVW